MARVDCTLLGCDLSLTYTIFGHEGDWRYSHDSGEVRKKYHFWRWSKRSNSDRRVTLVLSYDQVQAKVFQNHPKTLQTVNLRLDLNRLEGFYQ